MANVAGGLGDCGWERGTFYAGNAEHFAVSGNATLVQLATAWAASHGYACQNSTNANNQVCGAAYAQLYTLAPAPEKLALREIMDAQVANASVVDDWNWLDALFMALPTFLEYGALLNDTRYWDKAMAEYSWTAYTIGSTKPGITKKGLWDPAWSFFFRDPTYFNATSPNGAPVFWGRGLSWASSAMARAVRALPPGHPLAAEFAGKLVSIAHALAPLQDGGDGMWRANLLDAAAFPNPETTSTSGFTFALAYGVNSGILDAAVFTPIVLRAWAGLTSVALQPSGLVGWCQPPGAAPGPAVVSGTSDFCVGLWLMAGAEVYRLINK